MLVTASLSGVTRTDVPTEVVTRLDAADGAGDELGDGPEPAHGLGRALALGPGPDPQLALAAVAPAEDRARGEERAVVVLAGGHCTNIGQR